MIVVRMLIRDKSDLKQIYRIVGVNIFAQVAYLFNMNCKSWPVHISISKLQTELDHEDGRFEIVHDDQWLVPFVQIPEDVGSTGIRHKINWEIISPVVNSANKNEQFYKYKRKKLVDEICTNRHTTRQTVTSLLKRYWQRGMNFGALRPDYDQCGKRKDGGPRKLGEKKVGAPRRISSGIGVNADERVQMILQVGADYYFSGKRCKRPILRKKTNKNQTKPNKSKKGNERVSMRDAHDYIIRLYYCETHKMDDSNRIKVQRDNDFPTLRQLQYFINKNYTTKYRKIANIGLHNWELNEREILSSSDGNVYGPGDRYQVDATIADVFLRSQFDRRRIVGRPVIYFIIDVFSRMIVGLYVGFEGPSWAGAMMALINMVTPKVEFCRKYGIEIEEYEWQAHHAGNAILADKGELMSTELGHNIIKNLKITLDNTPSGRADLKGIVERRFGIVPRIFRPFTPGYIEKDFNTRNGNDYRLDAIYTLHEFTAQVIYAVLEHNSHPIRDLKIPPEMITEGLIPSPNELWNWGIINRSGCLKTLTPEEVALQVMPRGNATITSGGIRFNKKYYTCSTAIKEEWFSRGRGARENVPVSFDPRDLGYIYITDNKNPKWFERCHLLDKNKIYDGKSLFETEQLELDTKNNLNTRSESLQEARIEMDILMANNEELAKMHTNEVIDKDLPKSQQTSNIKTNRKDEKEFQRNSEVIILGNSDSQETNKIHNKLNNNTDIANAYESDLLATLRNNQKKRMVTDNE